MKSIYIDDRASLISKEHKGGWRQFTFSFWSTSNGNCVGTVAIPLGKFRLCLVVKLINLLGGASMFQSIRR